MTHAIYLRRQAEVLINLSRATIDLAMAARLRGLAAEFRAKADEFAEESSAFSSLALGAGRSQSARIDTD